MAYVFVVQIKEDTIDECTEYLHVFCTLTGVHNFLHDKVNLWKNYFENLPEVPTLESLHLLFANNETATLYTFGDYAVDRYTIDFVVHKKVLGS